MPMTDDRSLLDVILSDGRSLIALTGISIALGGLFVVLQSVSFQQDALAARQANLALNRFYY